MCVGWYRATNDHKFDEKRLRICSAFEPETIDATQIIISEWKLISNFHFIFKDISIFSSICLQPFVALCAVFTLN